MKKDAATSTAMRVIALESFKDSKGVSHSYGDEFAMEDTAERAALIDAGTIREDDRMTKGRSEQPTAP